MSTADVDRLVREDTQRRGGRPSQLGYHGFPAAVCTSVNHVVCHGIPSPAQRLSSGDLINVDVTTELDGFHGDTSATFLIGSASVEARHVVEVARRCLHAGIAEVRDGARVGDIGAAIEELARQEGCSVVRDYGGHGIGRAMHLEPHIPHTGTRGTGRRLRAGMVFTIEPMINLGEPDVCVLEDGWTPEDAVKTGHISANVAKCPESNAPQQRRTVKERPPCLARILQANALMRAPKVSMGRRTTLCASSVLWVCAAAACGDGSGPSETCNSLDTNVRAQATLKAYAQATSDLRNRASDVETQFLDVCNAINRDLGIDATKKTAGEACGVLKARVDQAIQNGATVNVAIDFNCQADLSAQASCEGSCQVDAGCDVEAKCTGGEVLVECQGQCDAQCDVTAPDFACEGECSGACTAQVEARCQGECSGRCEAPRFEGTCSAGCSANFEGTCEGTCEGMCNGQQSSGSCAGTCKGTCQGKASGRCEAACDGEFSGGECEGSCKGSCVTHADAQCSGSCNGTCSYTPGMASCEGTCHGMCSAEVSPPVCTGKLDCEASAECHSDCQAQASAKVDCPPPQAEVTVTGDAALAAALRAHIRDFGAAVNLTLALKDPIADVAGRTIGAFEALGSVGVSGAACLGASLQAAAEAQASINVSVMASASISASAN